MGAIAQSVPSNTRAELAKLAGVGAKTYDAGIVVINAAKNGTIAPEVRVHHSDDGAERVKRKPNK